MFYICYMERGHIWEKKIQKRKHFYPIMKDFYNLIDDEVLNYKEGKEQLYTEELLKEYSDPDSGKYKAMIQDICEKLGFTSLQYARLDDILEAISLEPCKLCTYCWNGKE